MSATGLLVGLLNILLVAVILILIGAVIEWLLRAILNFPVDPLVRRLYIGFVVIVIIIMLVKLLLGAPFRIIEGQSVPERPFPPLAYHAFNLTTHRVDERSLSWRS